jgi:hypothetical protein
MSKSLPVIFLAISFLFGLVAIGFCEDITLTTYYPAPYGSYNELLLFPHTPAVVTCDDQHKGLIYYDSAEDIIKVCTGSDSLWKAPSYWVLEGNSLHTQKTPWTVGIGTPPFNGFYHLHLKEGNPILALEDTGSGQIGRLDEINGSGLWISTNDVGTSKDIVIAPRTAWSTVFKDGGNVGIGVLNPIFKLEVSGETGAIGATTTNGVGVNAVTSDGFAPGIHGEGPMTGVEGVSSSSGSGGWGVHGTSASSAGVFGEGWGGVAGNGESYGVSGYSAAGTGVSGQSGSGTAGNFTSTSGTGVSGSGPIGIHGIGATAGLFDGDVTINGNLSITGTINGADVAEGIDCPGCAATDVVTIDPNNNLKFNRSSRAYDYTVAGVISEKPSLNLSKGDAKNHPPLALAGLVKCKVTDENGAIKRGDLLVTSSKPGHAMRADLDKIKPGMIVGKALEPWEKGEGKITVLVGSSN